MYSLRQCRQCMDYHVTAISRQWHAKLMTFSHQRDRMNVPIHCIVRAIETAIAYPHSLRVTRNPRRDFERGSAKNSRSYVMLFQLKNGYGEGNDDHCEREDLPHREREEDKTDLRIRRTEKFDEKSDDAIEEKIEKRKKSGKYFPVAHRPQNTKKNNPLKKRLIEL